MSLGTKSTARNSNNDRWICKIMIRFGTSRRLHLKSILVLAMSLLCVCGCQTERATGGASSTDLAYLRTAPEEWDRLFNSQDAAKLAALYAEDATSMPFNTPTRR